MKYNVIEKSLLLIMLYSDIFYLKYKWTYSHLIAIIVLIETIICFVFNTSFPKPIVLFSFWLISGIFVIIYLIINSIKKK